MSFCYPGRPVERGGVEEGETVGGAGQLRMVEAGWRTKRDAV